LLADDGLVRLGVDQRLTLGDDYELSKNWSQAIHDKDPNIDGIYYAARNASRNYLVALFDRSEQKLSYRIWGRLGDDGVADLFTATVSVLKRFDINLMPDPGER